MMCRFLSIKNDWQHEKKNIQLKYLKNEKVIFLNPKTINSVQEWLPFKEILDNGIIELKDFSYIKILKINPINFNLKSNLEKEAILNSYKIFLKTCQEDIQILIQTNKENLNSHIFQLNENLKNEKNKNVKNITKNYIKYIEEINLKNKSSSKKFFILIKEKIPQKEINETNQKICVNNLNSRYFKIKECLSRCGNNVLEINDKKEILNIYNSFFNYRYYLIKKWIIENIIKIN